MAIYYHFKVLKSPLFYQYGGLKSKFIHLLHTKQTSNRKAFRGLLAIYLSHWNENIDTQVALYWAYSVA